MVEFATYVMRSFRPLTGIAAALEASKTTSIYIRQIVLVSVRITPCGTFMGRLSTSTPLRIRKALAAESDSTKVIVTTPDMRPLGP